MATKQRNLFLSVIALFWFSLYTYPILLGEHAKNAVGASPQMVGMIVGSYGFTQMVLRIPLGLFSDIIKKRKLFIVLGSLFSLIAALGLFAATAPVALLLGRGSAGIAAACWVCFTVLYSDLTRGQGQTKAMGLLSATMYAAQMLANWLGSSLAQSAGTGASFLLAAAAGVAGILLAIFAIQDSPATKEPVGLRSLLCVLENRLLWVSAGFSVVYQLIIWATLYGFGPNWAQEILLADKAQVGLLSTVHLLPTIVFSLIGTRRLVPMLGERGCVSLGFICIAVSCLLMPLTTSFWHMLLLQALCGTGLGMMAPVLLALSIQTIAPANRGLGMGAYQSIYGIGMFLGPVLAGALIEALVPGQGAASMRTGYLGVYLSCGLLALCGAALCPLLLRRNHSPSQSV